MEEHTAMYASNMPTAQADRQAISTMNTNPNRTPKMNDTCSTLVIDC
jgi:hypothetical protein